MLVNLVADSKVPAVVLARLFKEPKDMPNPSTLKEVLTANPTPTLFVFRKDSQVFGAFASQAWNHYGKYGNERCFIFSIDKDVKFTPMLDKKNRLVYQWYQEDGMGWGSTDLTLRQDVARSHPRASGSASSFATTA